MSGADGRRRDGTFPNPQVVAAMAAYVDMYAHILRNDFPPVFLLSCQGKEGPKWVGLDTGAGTAMVVVLVAAKTRNSQLATPSS